jgi:hypothetical protein
MRIGGGMGIKLPAWVGDLGPRDEKRRHVAGLFPKKDGWYKSIDGHTRYVAKPMPLASVLVDLDDRVARIRARYGGPAVQIPVDALTLEQLAEKFLAYLLARLQGTGKRLRRRTYSDYVDVVDRFVEAVGPARLAAALGPDDFATFATTIAGRAASTRYREMQYVDRLFNWAGPGKRSMNMIGYVNRGPGWDKPTADDLRTEAADADKAYTVDQVRDAFAAAKRARRRNSLLWPAAHLGLNGAFNAEDVATLPEALVDLDGAMIKFPRGKTGVGRIVPLMPETVDALRWYLDRRPDAENAEAEALFFRTRKGYPIAKVWGEIDEAGVHENVISRRWGRHVGLPFTGLRSTVATWADDWPDQRAVDMLMGHKVGRVSGHVRARHYAKKVNPERVRLLVVRLWQLAFGPEVQSPLPGDADVAAAHSSPASDTPATPATERRRSA